MIWPRVLAATIRALRLAAIAVCAERQAYAPPIINHRGEVVQ